MRAVFLCYQLNKVFEEGGSNRSFRGRSHDLCSRPPSFPSERLKKLIFIFLPPALPKLLGQSSPWHWNGWKWILIEYSTRIYKILYEEFATIKEKRYPTHQTPPHFHTFITTMSYATWSVSSWDDSYFGFLLVKWYIDTRPDSFKLLFAIRSDAGVVKIWPTTLPALFGSHSAHTKLELILPPAPISFFYSIEMNMMSYSLKVQVLVEWFIEPIWSHLAEVLYTFGQARYIADCLDEMKQEIRSGDLSAKANVIKKLLYVSISTLPCYWFGIMTIF